MLPEVDIDTFWESATPFSQQMDETVIDELASLVGSFDRVYSFLMIRNGKIIHEQYHNGAKQNTLLPVRSITKRITATLTGIAIDKSYIDSLLIPISNYFPEISNPGVDPDWNTVNVYHLLNMISGMDWMEEEDLTTYENNFEDPLNFIFNRNIKYQPATYYAYNSPGIHLLSYIIERASENKMGDFAESYLFEPLDIKGYHWQADGNDVKRGGAGLELTSRDLAKIGLLYLQHGRWKNQPIISEQWIHQCLKQPIDLDTLEGNHRPGLSIGHTWWTSRYQGEIIHYGDGYGGQILLMIPKYEILVVMNRFYEVSGEENERAFNEFFSQILPRVFNSVLE